MTQSEKDLQKTEQEMMATEEKILHKVDQTGNGWTKVYFGGGAHFRNWLKQTQEVWGQENVEIEEVASSGFVCYEEGGEKMYRIWVRDSKLKG